MVEARLRSQSRERPRFCAGTGFGTYRHAMPERLLHRVAFVLTHGLLCLEQTASHLAHLQKLA
jgi:hypothetical protein